MFIKYTNNRQFDLQINRVISHLTDREQVQEDLKKILPQLKDIPSWNKTWLEFALKREKSGDLDLAASYFRAAEFYLLKDDPNRDFTHQHYRDNFYQTYQDFDYRSYEIPYKNENLPAIYLLNPQADKYLIIFGGYDSFLEELVNWAGFMKGTDYTIILFDGPGQGNSLYQGSRFIANFESPLKAVLDYFAIEQADIMGVSWGGYFAMRAAAFEKRINKVIAYDIFYSGLDALTNAMSPFSCLVVTGLIKFKCRRLINSLVTRKMETDLDTSWKINRGYMLTQTSSPYDLIQELGKHTMKGLGPLINQEVLLLAGEDDQYVPVKRLTQIEKELTNAAAVTTKLFNKQEGGSQHCQVGHQELAFAEIKKFLMN